MKHFWKWAFAAVLFLAATGCQEVLDLTCWGNCEVTIECDDTDDGNGVEEGTVTDPDGNTYRWKRMADGKKWLVENLNYDIPGYNSWWYDNDPENGAVYGRLYDWEAAKEACEALGAEWHLPTGYDVDNNMPGEWDDLADTYGNWNSDYIFNDDAYEILLAPEEDPYGRITGGSGFDALMGGYRNVDGIFKNLGYGVAYWSSEEVNAVIAWHYSFVTDNGKLSRYDSGKVSGFSCRCVHD